MRSSWAPWPPRRCWRQCTRRPGAWLSARPALPESPAPAACRALWLCAAGSAAPRVVAHRRAWRAVWLSSAVQHADGQCTRQEQDRHCTPAKHLVPGVVSVRFPAHDQHAVAGHLRQRHVVPALRQGCQHAPLPCTAAQVPQLLDRFQLGHRLGAGLQGCSSALRGQPCRLAGHSSLSSEAYATTTKTQLQVRHLSATLSVASGPCLSGPASHLWRC